jgi:hypothetical protein
MSNELRFNVIREYIPDGTLARVGNMVSIELATLIRDMWDRSPSFTAWIIDTETGEIQ